MADFEIVNGALLRYHGSDEKITIPDGVTEIVGMTGEHRTYDANADRYRFVQGSGAFTGCQALREITLPPTVQRIGDGAFKNCSNLTTVHFSENISVIAMNAFYGTGLRAVVLPTSLREIGTAAFAECVLLETVLFPPSLQAIGAHAFEGCSTLSVVCLPESILTLGKAAFAYCRQLVKLELPAGAEKLSVDEQICFSCPALTELHFPAHIDEHCFSGSAWYTKKQLMIGNCPVCGGRMKGNICEDPTCLTQYGKWER